MVTIFSDNNQKSSTCVHNPDQWMAAVVKDQVSEIFHVRMRLLDETVPVQPLVQREVRPVEWRPVICH